MNKQCKVNLNVLQAALTIVKNFFISVNLARTPNIKGTFILARMTGIKSDKPSQVPVNGIHGRMVLID
ncbi:MAG: hypothetical protein PUP46_03225 [Endozoicomonas sp. (ex Botrylloides leachii)]|nr:hypothetical protein [Endozoicomonas sp. (ex Botrylloides leachii)]